MDSATSTSLKLLLDRMDQASGFVGLGESVQTLSKLGDQDSDNKDIAAAILRDAALTAKLLRLANSSQRGGRNVATVDQAIAILGLNTVKSVAMSLALLDSLSNKPQSRQLHGEIVFAYFCGSLAFEITRLYAPRFNPQVAQVCGLMQNLGRMMALYHLYDELERSRTLQVEKNLSEEEAVQQTLGVRFEAISHAIAVHWNLPDILQKSLEAELDKPPSRQAADLLSWQQCCATFARQIGNVLFRLPENMEKVELGRIIDHFRTALTLKDQETQERIAKTLEETESLLAQISFPCTVDDARTQLRKSGERVLDLVKADGNLTKNQEEQGLSPLEVIQRTMRLIHEGLGFDRTILCLPQGSSALVAIAGVGRNANAIVPKFRCFSAQPDLLRIGLAKKMDLAIADTQNPNYAKLLPPWYREIVNARSFVILPLLHEEQTLGMIYGDYSEPLTQSPLAAHSEKLAVWRQQLIQALLAGAVKH